jgi:hypothetical protein
LRILNKEEFKMNGEHITVFSLKMAGYLMMRGFVLVETGANKRFPLKKVYFFNNKPEVLLAIEDYKNGDRNPNK